MSSKKIIEISRDDVEHQTPIGTRRKPPVRFVDTEEYEVLLLKLVEQKTVVALLKCTDHNHGPEVSPEGLKSHTKYHRGKFH